MRITALDGLRGLAALSVAVHHFCRYTDAPFYSGFPLGRLGVMIFFTLSGFLMARLYLGEDFSRDNVSHYFMRRVARVVPLFYVAVLAAYTLFLVKGSAWPFAPVNHQSTLEHMLFIDGDNVLWTIPVEMRFYLAFPVLWWLAASFGKGTMVLWATVFLAVLAWLEFPEHELVRFDAVPYFFVGVLAALVPVAPGRGNDVLFCIAVLAIVACQPVVRKAFGFTASTEWASVLLLLSMFLLIATCAQSKFAEIALGGRWMVYLGSISYSLYILHFPIIRVCVALGSESLGRVASAAICLSAILVVSALSFRFIELPMQKFVAARWPARRRPFPSPKDGPLASPGAA